MSDSRQLQAGPASARHYVLRLLPGEDLKRQLEAFVGERRMTAAAVLTCVGSLSKAALRMADAREVTRLEGAYEIVSLVGTLGPDGSHLHAAISDAAGRTLGGHVMEGCIVRTTAEIVLVELRDVTFSRRQDDRTGYRELQIQRK